MSTSSASPLSSRLSSTFSYFYRHNPLYYTLGWLRARIYNHLILSMTTGWYRAVLEDVEEHAQILDVGIGTAGALIACQDILVRRDIKVIGIDYDEQYIQQAAIAIENTQLSNRIRVLPMNVYQVQEHWKDLCVKDFLFQELDAVYFSGSFSLLPDWTQALRSVSELLKQSGNIYITQTYQKQSSVWLQWLKPWLRYLTTIDFGQMVMVDHIQKFYQDHAASNAGWQLLQHNVIPNNVDNPWQAAYLTVFKVA